MVKYKFHIFNAPQPAPVVWGGLGTPTGLWLPGLVVGCPKMGMAGWVGWWASPQPRQKPFATDNGSAIFDVRSCLSARQMA